MAHPGLPRAPEEPLDGWGAPRLGAYAGSLGRIDVGRLAAPPGVGPLARAARGKRWVYALVVTPEVQLGVAVLEAAYVGAAFAWVVDRATGAVLYDRSATGLPGLNARVNDRPGPGARASFAGPGVDVLLERRADRYHLDLELGGGAVVVDALLDARAAPEPFVLVARVDGGGFRATQKALCLPVEGRLEVRGRRFDLGGGLGGLDHTAGLLARETAWRWAFGLGRADGVPLGFNLAEGFGLAPDDPGENALARAGEAPWRLPPVGFEYDRLAPDRAPWRISSAGGAVELEFTPGAVHREEKRLPLVATRFAQVAGTFSGVLPGGPGGAPVRVDALPGVVEDHWARW